MTPTRIIPIVSAPCFSRYLLHLFSIGGHNHRSLLLLLRKFSSTPGFFRHMGTCRARTLASAGGAHPLVRILVF
jgi:hypothetical protein